MAYTRPYRALMIGATITGLIRVILTSGTKLITSVIYDHA